MDRGFEEQMESWECSSKQRDIPSLPPSPELFQEAEPRGPLEELEDQEGGHLSPSGSLNRSLQERCSSVAGEVERVPSGSPHPSLELSLVASSQESAERAQPLSPQSSIEEFFCTPKPPATGNQDQTPRVLKKEEVPRTASGPTMLSPSASLQQQQPWCSESRLSSLPRRAGRKAALVRPLSQWVCPVAEIVDPDSEVRPLEVYRRPRRVKKTEALARRPAIGSSCRVSPAASCPLPPSGSFPALGPGPQLPPLSLGLSSSGFQSMGSLSSPERHFLKRHLELPHIARSPSPTMWPGAKWPRGWESEAELLEELWAAHTPVPPQGLDPRDQEGQDPHRWSYPEPHILEATSQVMWKPMLLLEALKLAPGVSMWNPTTQVLLSSGTPQQDKEGCTSPPTE